MKKKRKIHVSNSNENNNNDNFKSPTKNNSNLNSSPEKPTNESDIKHKVNDELPNRSEVEQVLENENNSENTSNEAGNKLISVNTIFSVDELTPDDEVYTLQCPENFRKEDLCNKNIDLTNFKQSVTYNHEVFELKLLNSEKKFITLAVPKKTSGGSLVKMPLKGHIAIHKIVDMPANKPDDAEICDKVVFPDDLKVRHPLLGVKWKAHIDLANEIIKKENYLKNKNKKTKNKSLEVQVKKLKRENNDSENYITKKKKRSDF